MRSNRSGLRTAGSRGRVLAAVALLVIAGAVTLAVGSGAVLSGLTHLDQSARSRVAAFRPTALTPGSQPVLAAYGHLPLVFESNQGQSDPRVKFLARGSGYGLYLTANEAVLTLQPSAVSTQHSRSQRSVVRMSLEGAKGNSAIAGVNELPGKSNYFIGNDPAKWHRDVPQFAQVRYRNVYPGIDLLYYGNQGRLEYDFEAAPGSDPRQVTLRFQGPETLNIDSGRGLVLGLSGGEVRLQAPRVYQKFGDEERPVPGRFKLQAKDKVGFELGAYDPSRTLIIDPVLTYSTYLGGSGEESCSTILNQQIPTYPGTPGCPAITVDAVGSAYVAGSTTSADFPVTSGAYQGTLASGAIANVFIAKFNPAGSLVFATYLGGNVLDYTAGIAVDAGSNVIVAGTTSSSNFPTRNGFQSSPLSGGNHVFVSKLDPTGHTLRYSTYLSGNGLDIASGVALDPNGNAYVTGTTESTEVDTGFPSSSENVFKDTPASGATIQFFMTKIDPNLSGASSVVYSTYFGGGNSVRTSGSPAVGGGIAVDANSNVYITGGTSFLAVGQANDFPLLNAYQGCLDAAPSTTTCPTNVTAYDVFVAELNPAAAHGAQLVYSTYLGGTGDDIGYAITVDPATAGSNTINAYVTGSTTSTDFDAAGTGVLQPNTGGGTDAFLAKLGVPCTGTTCTTTAVPLNYFTYLGGTGTDIGLGVAVDSLQGARITGWTDSTDFHVTNNAIYKTFAGGTSDAFAARIDTTATTPTALGHYSTYLGGGGTDIGTSIAVDRQGASYLAGETSSGSSTPFPTKNPFQSALNGPSDAFVSKLGPKLSMTMTATGSPSPVGVGNQVSFVFKITNTGDFTNGVIFTDYLPASGATFVSATANPGTCGAPSGGTVLCNLGTSNPGASPATVTVLLLPVTPPTPGTASMLGNNGSVSVQGSTLATASASVAVNDYTINVAPATATVPAGVPATYTITVTPTGVIPSSISIACGAGLPTGATCLPGNNNPIPNLDNGPQSSQLIINTTARVTTTTRLWHGSGPLYATWLPLSGLALLGTGIAGKISRRRRFLIAALLAGFFALILFQAGCGSKKSTTTTTGTPAGTYTVTVNASSGSAVRTTTVTLVVQ